MSCCVYGGVGNSVGVAWVVDGDGGSPVGGGGTVGCVDGALGG